MRDDAAKASAVAKKILDFELLFAHRDDAVFQPCRIDRDKQTTQWQHEIEGQIFEHAKKGQSKNRFFGPQVER